MLEAALAVYEPAVGRAISRTRVALYNAACTLSFLAHRVGTSPHARCCGHTFPEDLAWTTHSVGQVLTGVTTGA